MYTLLQFIQKSFLCPYCLPFLFFVIFLFYCLSTPLTTNKSLPPSPPKLPIIGNFHQLGSLVHRSLLSLSQQYGKLMLLHLGGKPTLVVSSAEAIREIMKTHDLIFSNRPKPRVAKKIFYDCRNVAFETYGETWRLRKSICVMHLLSNQKVQSFCTIREEEIALMMQNINSFGSSVMNLRDIILTFTTDVMCRASFGTKYSSDCEGGINLKELLNEVMAILGAFSWGDFIPWLSWIDRLKGLDVQVEKVAKKVDEFLENLIKERQYRLTTKKDIYDDESKEVKYEKNFVDILLEYQKDNKDALPADSIKAVILDMLAPGIDTPFTLIEWTMSELIRHPQVMKQLQEEVRKIIGGKGQRVSEDDLEKLTYLKAVINEALRLHPPSPLLIFRESSRDVKINGFDIDAKTQVIINAWAIQRDPVYWDEPEEFRPKRFLNNSTTFDFRGQNFEFIPFGGGRRICPGMYFAMVIAELVVANLVCEFDWKLPGEEDCGKLDMTESAGFNVHKQVPLMVIASPCYSCK